MTPDEIKQLAEALGANRVEVKPDGSVVIERVSEPVVVERWPHGLRGEWDMPAVPYMPDFGFGTRVLC